MFGTTNCGEKLISQVIKLIWLNEQAPCQERHFCTCTLLLSALCYDMVQHIQSTLLIIQSRQHSAHISCLACITQKLAQTFCIFVANLLNFIFQLHFIGVCYFSMVQYHFLRLRVSATPQSGVFPCVPPSPVCLSLQPAVLSCRVMLCPTPFLGCLALFQNVCFPPF